MARKPPVPLTLQVRSATKTLVAQVNRKQRIPPAAFIGEVLDLYELLMYNFRDGGRIGAVSPDLTSHAPNLLVMKLASGKRRSRLSVRVPRTLRARCQRLTRMSGTDDVGLMFEKAVSLYGICTRMDSDGWSFYDSQQGRKPVQIRLFS